MIAQCRLSSTDPIEESASDHLFCLGTIILLEMVLLDAEGEHVGIGHDSTWPTPPRCKTLSPHKK